MVAKETLALFMFRNGYECKVEAIKKLLGLPNLYQFTNWYYQLPIYLICKLALLRNIEFL